MIPGKTQPPDPVITLPKADGRMPVHQVVQLDNHRLIPALLFLIAMRTGTQMSSLTCLTMADLMALDHMFSQAAFLIRRQSFFSTASLRASCTRLRLAYIRLSFAFSSSNSLRRLTSLASYLRTSDSTWKTLHWKYPTPSKALQPYVRIHAP